MRFVKDRRVIRREVSEGEHETEKSDQPHPDIASFLTVSSITEPNMERQP